MTLILLWLYALGFMYFKDDTYLVMLDQGVLVVGKG